MQTYVTQFTPGPAPLCGNGADGTWARANVLTIDNYPWHVGGEKQSTRARVLYDDDAIYLQFQCDDEHVSAQVVDLNGRVCDDSCVEFFANVDPDGGSSYLNLEINCCGTMLMGFGHGRNDRTLISPDLAGHIEIVTSVPAETKEESPDDTGWWVAAAVPFNRISEFAGQEVRPQSGAVWRTNFYRCGGRTDPQHACWNPIDWPTPDYHRPEFFGELRFA